MNREKKANVFSEKNVKSKEYNLGDLDVVFPESGHRHSSQNFPPNSGSRLGAVSKISVKTIPSPGNCSSSAFNLHKSNKMCRRSTKVALLPMY